MHRCRTRRGGRSCGARFGERRGHRATAQLRVGDGHGGSDGHRTSSSSASRPRASSTSSASRARRRWTSTSRWRTPRSSFVPVRHEQGGAYMADMYGRLTGRAGVCLGTLGPGAMNLVTAVGDAFLDRAPLVALTGQADLERMHKESHQYIDLVELFRPITKWNARVTSPEIVPEVVRKAFKVAESEKPGATHLELPEDVMAAEVDAAPAAAPRARSGPSPAPASCSRPPTSIRNALNPVALAGNGVVRAGAAPALREFCRATGHPRRRDVHGQGPARLRGPEGAGHRRPAGARLRDGRLRGRRRRASPSATTSSSTRPSTGTPSATRRSSSSTPSPRRSTSTSCPRSS